MPPWPADPGYSHFTGERYLSDKQINLIGTWVKQGTLRGDSSLEPKAREFYQGSYFGKPDLVIRSPKPIQIKGNGTDAFMILKFPYEIEKDTLVDFVEFVPHRRKLIHHVNGHLISYEDGRPSNYFSGLSDHNDTRATLMQVYADMHIPYADAANRASRPCCQTRCIIFRATSHPYIQKK